MLEGMGHAVLDPWLLIDPKEFDRVRQMPYGIERRDAWRMLNARAADTNRRAIDDCQAVFAVLDGVDVDSGTSAEIGYAFARGKKILGYRGDFRLSADNEGATVNLQVEYFIRESGGDIVFSLSEVREALKKLLGN